MPDVSLPEIQRPASRRSPGRKAVLSIPPEDIHPILRIAHRISGALSIAPRVIFDHELVFIHRGSGQLVMDGRTEQFNSGDLLFIRPFVSHAFRSDTNCDVEHTALHFDFASDVPKRSTRLSDRLPYTVQLTSGMSLPDKINLAESDPIVRAINDILRAWKSPGELRQMQSRLALTRMFELILHRQQSSTIAGGGATNRIGIQMQQAMEFAQLHYRKKLSAGDLAKASGLSSSHFSRLFRQWTSHSPAEYLRRLRVEKARELLADVGLSIKEIARLAGFDDACHFSKVFRQIDGLPPSRFRESLLAGLQRQGQ